jgi:predicted nucleotidyltransferase component of viral defense system
MPEVHFPCPHDADPEVFREALAYSEATTGFTATLIEKDYYCSLVLQYFFASDTSLVFRGGTCLSKVHANFYRLSEDLDFFISVTVNSTRSQRRAEMEPVKRMFEVLPTAIPGMAISEAIQGHNVSRQYIGNLEYRSAIVEKQEKIKVEVGVREPLLNPSESKTARTIVVNPFSSLPLLPTFTVRAMELREAYAEKLRAAMTRIEPAIRDFFDVFYAVQEIGLDIHNADFLSIVKAKIEVPGNAPVDVSPERKRELYKQLDGQLRPVLRPADFVVFNLDEAFELVCEIAKAVSP